MILDMMIKQIRTYSTENINVINPPRDQMKTELTEAEMRQALFGSVEATAPANVRPAKEQILNVTILPPQTAKRQKKSKPLTPKIRVTLRVGNEFEGHTECFSYDANTLSTILAEQEATKAARKKFKYVEVVSIKAI